METKFKKFSEWWLAQEDYENCFNAHKFLSENAWAARQPEIDELKSRIDTLEKMDLKMFMFKKGIKQLDIAQQLGVHPSLINLLVNNRRGLAEKHLVNFCKALEINPEEFRKGNIRKEKTDG